MLGDESAALHLGHPQRSCPFSLPAKDLVDEDVGQRGEGIGRDASKNRLRTARSSPTAHRDVRHDVIGQVRRGVAHPRQPHGDKCTLLARQRDQQLLPAALADAVTKPRAKIPQSTKSRSSFSTYAGNGFSYDRAPRRNVSSSAETIW